MLLSLSVASVFAQSSLIATLSHDGEITAFYGVNALKEAHEAARHGDAITLSSGTFAATDITKAVTLRGAGMKLDSINNVFPTIIAGNFSIQIADDVAEKLYLEGIYHNNQITLKGNLGQASFLKCRFSRLVSNGPSDGIMVNARIMHCNISTVLSLTQAGSDCSIINSIICTPEYYEGISNGSSMQFLNCVVITKRYEYTHYFNQLEYCSFNNCILVGYNGGYYHNNDFLPSTCSAYNCVAINCYEKNCFKNIPNTTNKHSEYSEVFKDFAGIYNDDIAFELTDDAKVKFLGLDDTQVGIYGGSFPFDPTTTNPHITKCNVAAKSTADGKLSVDIEVAGVD